MAICPSLIVWNGVIPEFCTGFPRLENWKVPPNITGTIRIVLVAYCTELKFRLLHANGEYKPQLVNTLILADRERGKIYGTDVMAGSVNICVNPRAFIPLTKVRPVSRSGIKRLKAFFRIHGNKYGQVELCNDENNLVELKQLKMKIWFGSCGSCLNLSWKHLLFKNMVSRRTNRRNAQFFAKKVDNLYDM